MSNKKDKFFIKTSNLPPKLPLTATLFWWLLLDYTSAPEWLFGVFGFLFVILWIVFFYEMFTKKAKDLFDS